MGIVGIAVLNPIVVASTAVQEYAITKPQAIVSVCLGYAALVSAVVTGSASVFFTIGAVCLLTALILYCWPVKSVST
ncbi:hypothetical protein HY633_04295 [Candidatus Uhrbacteria bacterium]|nr:hypothetical protein [Candidatus Uhrbacteria bacterium]